eukprot:scaffold104964_cov33-Phaeocystis_antarctica.AAC.1
MSTVEVNSSACTRSCARSGSRRCSSRRSLTPNPNPNFNPNRNQVLIKEITRRCNLCGICQAAYTAGIVLPKPVACCRCRYYHRSLNPKKLIEVRPVPSYHP